MKAEEFIKSKFGERGRVKVTRSVLCGILDEYADMKYGEDSGRLDKLQSIIKSENLRKSIDTFNQ